MNMRHMSVWPLIVLSPIFGLVWLPTDDFHPSHPYLTLSHF
jgi:hypothetical protein